MKNILNKLVVLLLAGFALAACTEHTEYDDTGFSAVEKLLYPSDGYALDLIEQADANLYFEWEVSKVGTPVYTVVFLDAAKKEIGRYLADNNGQKSSLKMLHSQLNAIAGDAGIEPDAAGDLYWTVSAGLGGAEQLSPAEPHKLTVKRYASIDAPYHLYVTGEGSEFGTDPAAAKQMRELGDGKFEIYTRFTGSFSFINRNAAGSKRTFGVAEGRLTEGADAAGTGDLYWAVESKLLSWTALSSGRKLTVTRMKGIPTAAYITGAASEFGSGYQALKALGAGKFEIFTKLTTDAAGYNFTDGDTADARKFVVEGGAIRESDASVVSSEEAIYYILLDFGAGTAKLQKIENMRYLSPNVKTQHTEKQIKLPYQGNGIWYAAGVVPYLRDWDDDRYFFWAEVDGVKTKFGANPGMTGDLNSKPAENDSRFRVFWPIADVNGDDAGAFKMLHAYRGNDSKRVNIKLNMSPDTEYYYNYIEYLD